jgi:hypothetical protein
MVHELMLMAAATQLVHLHSHLQQTANTRALGGQHLAASATAQSHPQGQLLPAARLR